jgi:hypothetical protein
MVDSLEIIPEVNAFTYIPKAGLGCSGEDA